MFSVKIGFKYCTFQSFVLCDNQQSAYMCILIWAVCNGTMLILKRIGQVLDLIE